MTRKEEKLKAKAWDIMYEEAMGPKTGFETLHRMHEIIKSLKPEQHTWSWALEMLLKGEKITWKDWNESYIEMDDIDGLIRRYSYINEFKKGIGVYGIADREKFVCEGWSLYEEG